jgi:hypothetical protein
MTKGSEFSLLHVALTGFGVCPASCPLTRHLVPRRCAHAKHGENCALGSTVLSVREITGSDLGQKMANADRG